MALGHEAPHGDADRDVGFAHGQKAASTGSTSSLREEHLRPHDSPTPCKVASNVMGVGAGGTQRKTACRSSL